MKISSRTSSFLAVALGAFAIVGGTGLTVSSAWLITMASQHPPVLVLSVAIVMVRFFGIFRSVARYGERVISHEAVFRKLTGIRVELFQAIAKHLRQINVALRAKSIIDDVERAQEFYLRITLPRLSAAISVVFTNLIASWINPILLMWILPSTIVFAFLIPAAVSKLLDPISREIEDCENIYAESISTSSYALVEAEVFGYSDKYKSQLRDSAIRLSEMEKTLYRRISALQALFICTLALTLLGLALTLKSGENFLPVQISMTIFLVLVGFEGYTSWFPNLFPAGKIRRAAENIDSLASSGEQLTSIGTTPVGTEIIADEISPYWDSAFLPGLSFTLNRGETLVITGASGVGKSTLAAALFGFASYSGSLTVGGVEIRELSNPSDYISGSLQNGHIFNTTLRENIKIANQSVEDYRIQEILTSLELDEIALDEMIGEFGRALSGGEAKRVSIARALVSTSPILILDEPLEHLDSDRADRIQKVIMRECSDRALIVITHAPWPQYSKKVELARE